MKHRARRPSGPGGDAAGLNLEVSAGVVKTRCTRHTAADGNGSGICPRCGGRIPSDDATEVLLETLTQLAQFGLDAEARTLLEPSDEDH